MNESEFIKQLSSLNEIDLYLNNVLKQKNFLKGSKNFKSFIKKVFLFIEKRNDFKKQFTESDIYIIKDENLRKLLRQISSSKKFIADLAIESLSEKEIKKDEFLSYDEGEIDELASNALFSWIGPRDYIEGIIEIGVIVTNVNLPSIFSSYLQEAKKCYAFQQYNAVNALCRIILEISIKDIYTRRGFKLDDSKENCKDKTTTAFLISKISSGQLKRKLKSLYYGKLSPTIHGDESVFDKHVKIHLKETVELIEQLYDTSFRNAEAV